MRGVVRDARRLLWLPLAGLAALLLAASILMLPGEFGPVELAAVALGTCVAGISALRVRAWGQAG